MILRTKVADFNNVSDFLGYRGNDSTNLILNKYLAVFNSLSDFDSFEIECENEEMSIQLMAYIHDNIKNCNLTLRSEVNGNFSRYYICYNKVNKSTVDKTTSCVYHAPPKVPAGVSMSFIESHIFPEPTPEKKIKRFSTKEKNTVLSSGCFREFCNSQRSCFECMFHEHDIDGYCECMKQWDIIKRSYSKERIKPKKRQSA